MASRGFVTDRSTDSPCPRARYRVVGALLAAGLVLLLGGCSGGGAPLSPPSIAPEEAAKQALAEYDTNKDGFLDATELQRCPALKSALSVIDTNKDGKISAEELAARLAEFQKANVGVTGVPCRVFLDGSPLAEATVTLEPEKFMGPGTKSASGTSDATGSVVLRVEGVEVPGVQWGYYRVLVSRKDIGGKELLPARYNTATTLGQEVATSMRGGVSLRLTSE
jgi:hypothetical protein